MTTQSVSFEIMKFKQAHGFRNNIIFLKCSLNYIWKSYKIIYSRWSLAYVCELMIMVVYVFLTLLMFKEETFYFTNTNVPWVNSYLQNLSAKQARPII